MKLSQAEVQRAEELIDAQIDEAHRDGAYIRVIERHGPVAVVEINGTEALIDPLGVIGVLQRMKPEPEPANESTRPKLKVVK